MAGPVKNATTSIQSDSKASRNHQESPIQFNTFEFLIFFLVVFSTYWFLPLKGQNLLLLIASYVFYGAWDWRFLLLLMGTTIVDYLVGLRLQSLEDEGKRRRTLVLSIVANLGVLSIFKYYGFFVESAGGLLGRIGVDFNPTSLEIILPVGISFYTFQSMSYTIDVYRKRMPACRSLPDFALFVSFFPQLVAGPIERAKRLLPQLQTARPRLTSDRVQTGIALIIEGLVRKVVIADIAAPVVNRIFALSGESSWKSLVVGVVAFGLQIYGDFSGYSAIARGTARLLGIELMHNFREPYLARNITEFWRCWHISLSSWLRDYLYVPLGGSRAGRARTYFNLLIVMTLGGLWHGAAWTFVVWGVIHGALLAFHKMFRRIEGAPEGPIRWRDVPPIALTLVAVNLAWVFFRADSLGTATTILSRIFTRQSGFFDVRDATLVIVLVVATLAIDLFARAARGRNVAEKHPFRLGLATGVGLAFLVVASGGEIVPFIYFQF